MPFFLSCMRTIRHVSQNFMIEATVYGAAKLGNLAT